MNNTILSPVQKFIKTESFSGVLLFVVTLLAFILSNTPLREYYDFIWQYKVGIQTEDFTLVKPLLLWINDGLMVVFFFLIGLEIKREILIGELNSLKKASLPVFAAIGGMIVPVFIFLVLNTNHETQNAWGISMATDIAFTLAILKLLGDKVPLGLKVFLTAFAIIDDIGAVIVIAVFYSGTLSWMFLLYAAILLIALYILSFLKIHNKFLIFITGIVVWFLFLKAGIHPTLAGILLAFAVPVRQHINEFEFVDKLKEITGRLVESVHTNALPVLSQKQIEEIDNLEDWTNKVQSPVQQLEHHLHKWVAYLIMPVFALANAGVTIIGNTDIDLALVIAITVSLFLGKTVGVSLFSFLSLKLKLSTLPANINFKQITGVAVLSGLGFTMSLFIGGLAFTDNAVYLNSAKVGILAGSLISGIIGYMLIRKSIESKK